MPKSAKLDSKAAVFQDKSDAAGEGEARPVRAGSNGYDGEKLQGFIDRVQELQGQIDGIMEKAKKACAPHRDDIALVKKEAAEAGFSKTEFATILRKLRLERKVEQVANKLDDDQMETFEAMMHALGAFSDTPLGKAAADKHAGMN